jgi:hypothetical protein
MPGRAGAAVRVGLCCVGSVLGEGAGSAEKPIRLSAVLNDMQMFSMTGHPSGGEPLMIDVRQSGQAQHPDARVPRGVRSRIAPYSGKTCSNVVSQAPFPPKAWGQPVTSGTSRAS